MREYNFQKKLNHKKVISRKKSVWTFSFKFNLDTIITEFENLKEYQIEIIFSNETIESKNLSNLFFIQESKELLYL